MLIAALLCGVLIPVDIDRLARDRLAVIVDGNALLFIDQGDIAVLQYEHVARILDQRRHI